MAIDDNPQHASLHASLRAFCAAAVPKHDSSVRCSPCPSTSASSRSPVATKHGQRLRPPTPRCGRGCSRLSGLATLRPSRTLRWPPRSHQLLLARARTQPLRRLCRSSVFSVAAWRGFSLHGHHAACRGGGGCCAGARLAVAARPRPARICDRGRARLPRISHQRHPARRAARAARLELRRRPVVPFFTAARRCCRPRWTPARCCTPTASHCRLSCCSTAAKPL